MLIGLAWLLALVGYIARQWWDYAVLIPLLAALLTILAWPFGLALITISLCNHPKERRSWMTLLLFMVLGVIGFFLCGYALAPIASGVA